MFVVTLLEVDLVIVGGGSQPVGGHHGHELEEADRPHGEIVGISCGGGWCAMCKAMCNVWMWTVMWNGIARCSS
jgi:hypothetical protein